MKITPITANYQNIRDELQTGDLLVFGGFFLGSRIIKFFTRSNVSHLALVLKHPKEQRLSLFEVSTGSVTPEHNGVNTHKVSDYVPFYHGNVWVLKLRDSVRKKFNEEHLRPFIEKTLGQNFDTYGAGLAGWDLFDNIQGSPVPRSASYFCSELVAEAFMHTGILPNNIHPEEITPADLTRLDLYKSNYYQVRKKKGKTIKIKRNELSITDLPTVRNSFQGFKFRLAKSMERNKWVKKWK